MISPVLAFVALAAPVQESDLDALVKAWSDVRFWIVSDGKRSGWQRTQARWGEFAGEKTIVVDYERATFLFTSERFTAWLRPDATLSPRAIRWGNNWYTLNIDKGTIGFQGRDPGRLSLFPEMLAFLVPLKEGGEIASNRLSPHASTAEPAKLTVAGKEKDGWKLVTTAKVSHLVDPETWETQMWIKPDRTIVKVLSTITYTTSHDGKNHRRTEELVPVRAKEWEEETIAANEFQAQAQICLLLDLSHTLRANDLEANNSNDYWTGDVSGLFRLIPSKQKDPMMLISKEVALADATPLPAGPEKGGGTMGDLLGPKPVPYRGYFFTVLKKSTFGGEVQVLNEGTNHHPSNLGFCAYPAEYGKTGRRTFVISAYAGPAWKDNKGRPVTEEPGENEGWRWDGPRR
jgi:hypothetical protein